MLDTLKLVASIFGLAFVGLWYVLVQILLLAARAFVLSAEGFCSNHRRNIEQLMLGISKILTNLEQN
jgi:hypothetical protein